MREIIFDTETTGLDNRADRIIELGAIELVNRFPTGRTFHEYINPQGRPVHPEALAIHGISDAQLAGKPIFPDVAGRFLEFIDGAMLVAHNAMFDLGFINAEFERVGHPLVEVARIVDTLAIARRKHPMGPNSLDALCKRYRIDNSHRTKHGALLDSELLAEVYIEMIGGKQAALVLDGPAGRAVAATLSATVEIALPRPAPLAPRISEAERAAHEKLRKKLGGSALWNRGADAAAS
ncbi:MAG: DNA polymerase III subunit epsilon [Rhizobiaceae bacterium]|nr:DNA polymerase III subunit epsilon [Rhizobiaceae bacterium]